VANGWGGVDPTQASDPTSYELGTQYHVNTAVTVTAVRVWAGPGSVAVTARRGHIWTTVGTLAATITMADTLPGGWSTYTLDTPISYNTSDEFVVSYTTGGNYGVVSGGLSGSVNSGDGALTAVSNATGAHGNGSFTLSPGSFPTNASGGTFYGIDVVYNTGGGGDLAINEFTVTADGTGAATAIIVATETGGLVGATYSFDWGDGSRSLGLSSGVAHHTYTADGTYGVLGWVTDSGGTSVYAAAGIDITVPGPGVVPLDSTAIINAALSDLSQTGLFETVEGHEPRSAPGNGLTVAAWVEAIDPLGNESGLASTTALLLLTVRIHLNAVSEPLDAIDPAITQAVDAVMAAYNGDFTLGGLIKNVDIFGTYGTRLAARAGYVTISNTTYRCMNIAVPCVVGDVWTQSP
jgi:hypothetical protein